MGKRIFKNFTKSNNQVITGVIKYFPGKGTPSIKEFERKLEAELRDLKYDFLKFYESEYHGGKK